MSTFQRHLCAFSVILNIFLVLLFISESRSLEKTTVAQLLIILTISWIGATVYTMTRSLFKFPEKDAKE